MYELEGPASLDPGQATALAAKAGSASPAKGVADAGATTGGNGPDRVAAYADGRFTMVPTPGWWREEEFFSSASLVTSFEIGPLRNGVIARQAPEGITVCLVANDERQDVRMLWCPTEADYAAFLCGPGAVFAQTCATILAADPLKRGSWK